MTGGEEVLAAGLIAGGAMTIMLLVLAFWVLIIIARWKIFTKAGEAGWKSIIPVYSDYIQWRISWKNITLFWVTLALVIVGSLLMSISGSYSVDAAGNIIMTETSNPLLSLIGSVAVIVALVLDLIATYKMLVAFGHGVGWFVLYILFPNIMLLVLGFGSSTYHGPQD